MSNLSRYTNVFQGELVLHNDISLFHQNSVWLLIVVMHNWSDKQALFYHFGYPPALTARSQNSANTKKMMERRSSVVLPYYRGLSEKLHRCPMNHKIKLFFKLMRTFGDKQRNGKDPVHPFDCQGAVYCVPCGDCDQKYFGKTKRSFKTHKKEPINFIKHFHPEKSALAKHALELELWMNWSKTQIVAFENDCRKRRFIESFFINSTPNVINEKS